MTLCYAKNPVILCHAKKHGPDDLREYRLHDDLRAIYLHRKAPRFHLRMGDPTVTRISLAMSVIAV
jgi:hypothetical protein